MFNIWKYCHKYRLADQISIALITAAVLTSPDRQLMTNSGESDRRNVIHIRKFLLHSIWVSIIYNSLIILWMAYRDVLPVVNDLHVGIITSLHLHLSIIDRKNHSFPKGTLKHIRNPISNIGLTPARFYDVYRKRYRPGSFRSKVLIHNSFNFIFSNDVACKTTKNIRWVDAKPVATFLCPRVKNEPTSSRNLWIKS